jgi:hypothetical protein
MTDMDDTYFSKINGRHIHRVSSAYLARSQRVSSAFKKPDRNAPGTDQKCIRNGPFLTVISANIK